MRPLMLSLTSSPTNSFTVRRDLVPNVNSIWHFHEEFELLHINSGSGTYTIGDKVGKFQTGDVFFVGSKLPHCWSFDLDSSFREVPYVSSVVHFSESFLGVQFLSLPENDSVRNILEKGKRGILLRGGVSQKIVEHLNQLANSEGLRRLILLLECLNLLASSGEGNLLASGMFNAEANSIENKRINSVYTYTMKNFKDKIYLDDVAKVAGLTTNSFCRFFKQKTGKTYSEYVWEIKIGYACKLLIDNILNIKEICYESGFNNHSCFFEKFKLVTGYSPKEYQNKYLDVAVS